MYTSTIRFYCSSRSTENEFGFLICNECVYLCMSGWFVRTHTRTHRLHHQVHILSSFPIVFVFIFNSCHPPASFAAIRSRPLERLFTFSHVQMRAYSTTAKYLISIQTQSEWGYSNSGSSPIQWNCVMGCVSTIRAAQPCIDSIYWNSSTYRSYRHYHRRTYIRFAIRRAAHRYPLPNILYIKKRLIFINLHSTVWCLIRERSRKNTYY